MRFVCDVCEQEAREEHREGRWSGETAVMAGQVAGKVKRRRSNWVRPQPYSYGWHTDEKVVEGGKR
jgi:hypothetical protein